MEISGTINYERLFPLELRDPATEEPLGIVFHIRSAQSKEAKAILRKHLDENMERVQKGKGIKGVVMEEQALEKVASYIASWDWGQHTWEGKKPELSMKAAIEIFERQEWIYSEVKGAADTIANFTGNSGKPSVKP